MTTDLGDRLMAAGFIRVTWRDDDAAHQVRLSFVSPTNKIAVSCTCMPVRGHHGSGPMHAPLAILRSPDDSALAVWRAHIAQETEVAP